MVAMLTVERLSDVNWTLDKLEQATTAIEKLIEGEPLEQPPGHRLKALREMVATLSRVSEELEGLFA